MLCSMCFVLLGAGPLIGSPATGSLEEAETNIVARFNAIQSLAATIVSEESQSEGAKKTSVTITRQIEWMRKGASFLYRAQNQTILFQSDAHGTSRRETTSTTVSDGASVVQLTDQDGTVSATRQKADVTVTPDVSAMFAVLRKDSTLKRLPDVKVGLDDCYAIQVVPKEKKGSDILQTMIYFRKDIGLDVRTVVYGKDNQPIYTSTTSAVRLNPTLPPDRFLVVLPDGVELKGQTAP